MKEVSGLHLLRLPDDSSLSNDAYKIAIFCFFSACSLGALRSKFSTALETELVSFTRLWFRRGCNEMSSSKQHHFFEALKVTERKKQVVDLLFDLILSCAK